MKYKDYCDLPTQHGTFRMYDSGDENFRIITYGALNKLGSKPIVRVHSSCLASEVFEARDCDCADQLRETMKLIAQEGRGLIFHLHQEGRGQGLTKKIQAVYKMQSENIDTVESFEAMGLKQDIREYSKAIEVLEKLNIKEVRLVSNNPRKRKALEDSNINVSVINTHPQIRKENADYLQSKNEKLGHYLPLNESETMNEILFYHSDQMWGEFSNFSRHAIFIDGKIWQTVEHYYQAQKFEDENLQEEIRTTNGPMAAKEYANKLKFKFVRKNWNELKEDFMWKGLFAKFSQHPELKYLLLSTNNLPIKEHTKNDLYWGDGLNNNGKNRLGELLMKLREEITKKIKF